MAKQTFWHLDSPDSMKKLADYRSSVDWESVICPKDAGHQRAGKRITDLSVTLRTVDVDDFVWTFLSDCMIQDDVLKLFRANKVTGFEVKPVKARHKRDKELLPPKLWELVVTGWAGMAPPESGVRLTRHCEACGLSKYSGFKNAETLIDERQWDGSDFFMVWPLPAFIFVTDRVARLIRDNELTGVQIVALRDIKPAHDGLGGGRLSYWMPDARARELGKPLGIY